MIEGASTELCRQLYICVLGQSLLLVKQSCWLTGPDMDS